jgi:hypothetical protein
MISRIRLTALLVFLFSLGALGCSGGSDLTVPVSMPDNTLASGQSIAGGSLTGYEGQAIPLADIYVDGDLNGFTNEDGSYQINLQPGEHTIAFGYDEIIFHETAIDTSSRTAAQFPRPPKVGRVKGTVFAKAANDENSEFKPLANAIVIVADLNTRWFDADVTDDEGHYKIEFAPAGPARLLVFARGFLPHAEKIFINPASVLIKDVFMRHAPNMGHLLGIVRDPDFNPVADALVLLGKPDDPAFELRARTRDCGVFLINKIEPGRYVLHVQKQGYEDFNKPVLIERGRNFVKIKLIPEVGGDG